MSDELTREQVDELLKRYVLNSLLYDREIHYHAILAVFDAQRFTIETLREELRLQTGAKDAQDEREKLAGERCGVDYARCGCDWPDAAAVILRLREQRDAAIRVAKELTEPAPVTEQDVQWATDTLSVVERYKQERDAALAKVRELEIESEKFYLKAIEYEREIYGDPEHSLGLRHHLKQLQQRVKELEAQVNDLKQRNQILRTRPDLPMTDPQKELFKQAEQRVAQLEEALRELQTILTASIVVGQYRETLLRIVQQALKGDGT